MNKVPQKTVNKDRIKEEGIRRSIQYICAVTIAFVVIILAFAFIYRNMENIKINQKQNNSLFIAQKIDYYLSKNKENLNLAAANIESYTRQGQDNQAILAYMKQESTATSAVVDENFSGIYGWINGEYLDGMDYVPDDDYVPQSRPWYIKAAEADGETVLITPYIDSQTLRMIVSLSKMLEDKDSVLSMDIYLDYLQELVMEQESGGAHLIVKDELGNVVSVAKEELIGSNDLVIPRSENPFAYYEKTAKYEVYETNYDNVRSFCFDQTIIGGWHVILIVDRKDVLQSLWSLYVVCILAMLIVLSIETIVFRKMNSQIISVERYSGRLSCVSDIYLAMFDIDLESDSYSVIKSLPFIDSVIQKYDGPVSKIMPDIIADLCVAGEKERIKDFVNYNTISEALKNSTSASIEVKGLMYFARITFVEKSRNAEGKITNIMLLIEDIDKEIAKRRELMKEANTDKMTGLLNRRAWEEALSETRQNNDLSEISIIVVDVNGLKKANDNLGHAAGDEIIIATAAMIKTHFDRLGDAFRIGGDEFALLIKNPYFDPDKTIEEFKTYISSWSGNLVDSLSVSVGYAMGSKETAHSIDDLINFADSRMYEDKNRYYECQR